MLLALIAAARAMTPSLHCEYHVGVTASTDSFYQGQERRDSFPRYVPRHLQGMTEEWRHLHVLNYEMESSTLLTVCSVFGLRAGCVTGVINRRSTDERSAPITPEDLRLGEEHAVRVGIAAVEILITQAG